MKLDKKLHQESVDYSMQAIKHICQTFPPREPGSEGERKAQEYLKEEILSNNWADSAVIEEFSVAPKAFMSFTKIIPIMVAIGMILFALTGAGLASLEWAPLVLGIISFGIFIAEFGLYKEFLDPFFKKETSSNLVAVKKATEETKKRIVFSGHTDAAYEWTIFHHFGKAIYLTGLILAIVGILVSIALSITALVKGFAWWQFIVMVCFIPPYITLFLYCNYKRVVPGANDNLTGSLASVAILKYLKEAGISFKNTDVAILLTGSEEAGLRGAKAWAKAHKEECESIPTMFIGLETFRDKDHLSNYVKDLSGTVKHHPDAIKLIDDAAEKVFGNPLPHASVFLGASDAAAVTQAGITAGAIASMDPAPATYYHTRKDHADNLSPECFGMGLELALNVLDIYAKE